MQIIVSLAHERFMEDGLLAGFEISHLRELYAAYEKASGIPVCVAFGVGGTPENPKEVYFHKLAALRYGFLTQSFVRGGTSCF